jgi:hypothetical protein
MKILESLSKEEVHRYFGIIENSSDNSLVQRVVTGDTTFKDEVNHAYGVVPFGNPCSYSDDSGFPYWPNPDSDTGDPMESGGLVDVLQAFSDEPLDRGHLAAEDVHEVMWGDHHACTKGVRIFVRGWIVGNGEMIGGMSALSALTVSDDQLSLCGGLAIAGLGFINMMYTLAKGKSISYVFRQDPHYKAFQQLRSVANIMDPICSDYKTLQDKGLGMINEV